MSDYDSPATRRRLQAVDADERPDLLDELARQAADGDNDAAADLAWAVREFRLAHSGLRKYLMSNADLDNGEQRVLIAVAYRIGSFRGESRFTTWLHRVAMNEAKMVLRGEQRHTDRAAPESGFENDPESGEDIAENFVARVSSMVVNRAVVRAAIDAIDEPQRTALILREDQGLSYSEISDSLAVPVGTAKTWVRRARGELATRLTNQLQTPDETD